MLNGMKNVSKSGASRITAAVAISAALAMAMEQGFTSVRADTPHHASTTAMTKHATCSVAGKAGGAGAMRGNSVVVRGTLINGKKLDTAKWHGKVVLVDFWATWCPWCRAEMPTIEKLYRRYHRQGLEIVGVPLSDTATAVRSYLKAHPNVAWPEVFDKGAGNATLAQKLGVSAFPAQCVIDRRGVWQYTVVGAAQNQLGGDMQRLTVEVRKMIRNRSRANKHENTKK
ncbi:MAG: TlpA disulfide reductase family protein [Planctomycetia bacterium]|nr:TlpA disulfide reductase family protein [Planctomycetia bacterium]